MIFAHWLILQFVLDFDSILFRLCDNFHVHVCVCMFVHSPLYVYNMNLYFAYVRIYSPCTQVLSLAYIARLILLLYFCHVHSTCVCIKYIYYYSQLFVYFSRRWTILSSLKLSFVLSLFTTCSIICTTNTTTTTANIQSVASKYRILSFEFNGDKFFRNKFSKCTRTMLLTMLIGL